jgi:HlyD family secretion protein
MRTPALDGCAVALITTALVMLSGCSGEPEPDAYGTFEAVEVVVSSQASGQVQEFTPEEGMQLALGTVAAVIDTAQLALERQQVVAQRNASSSRGTEVTEQLRVLEVERDIAQRAYERTRRLHAAQAATSQQLDQAEREYRTLTARIQGVRAQRESVGMDVTANDARVDQIAERIAKSIVVNPQAGIVLTTYTRAGEVVQPGQPLYRIADLRTLVLRAYITGAQLASVRLGQPAQVRVDQGRDELLTLPGTVTWIAAEAEFTPTPIQTREERADLVYAVKVLVANPDGVLKIGMPGDVIFVREPQPAAPQS